MNDTEKRIQELNQAINKLTLQTVPSCVAEFIDRYPDIDEVSLLVVMYDFVESEAWLEYNEIENSLSKYGRRDDMLYKAIRFGYYLEDHENEPKCFLKNKIPLKEISKDCIVSVQELYLTDDNMLIRDKDYAKQFKINEVENVTNGVYELEFEEGK